MNTIKLELCGIHLQAKVGIFDVAQTYRFNLKPLSVDVWWFGRHCTVRELYRLYNIQLDSLRTLKGLYRHQVKCKKIKITKYQTARWKKYTVGTLWASYSSKGWNFWCCLNIQIQFNLFSKCLVQSCNFKPTFTFSLVNNKDRVKLGKHVHIVFLQMLTVYGLTWKKNACMATYGLIFSK